MNLKQALLIAAMVIVSALLTLPLVGKKPIPPVPTDNPLAQYRLPWAEALPWRKAIDIRTCEGESATERLADAQRKLGASGGVVYFPPGIYRFEDDIVLKNGILLRGVAPKEPDAKLEDYYPQARIEFPRYVPRNEGTGEPTASSFKVIRLEDPENSSNCGVLNLAINRGQIVFGEGEGRRAGRNRLVYGCSITNAAGVSKKVPLTAASQRAWQRYPDGDGAAIQVSSGENALIANNRLPEGYPDSFTMNGYVLTKAGGRSTAQDAVVFDFNDRPGIRLDLSCAGEGGIIRDNSIFSTGRTAVTYTVKKVLDTGNVIQCKPGVARRTFDGVHLLNGPLTNDFQPVKRVGCSETNQDRVKPGNRKDATAGRRV